MPEQSIPFATDDFAPPPCVVVNAFEALGFGKDGRRFLRSGISHPVAATGSRAVLRCGSRVIPSEVVIPILDLLPPTWFHPGGVNQHEWVVIYIAIEIRTNVELERIFSQESPNLGVVVSGAIVRVHRHRITGPLLPPPFRQKKANRTGHPRASLKSSGAVGHRLKDAAKDRLLMTIQNTSVK